jgi:hypothetical protein
MGFISSVFGEMKTSIGIAPAVKKPSAGASVSSKVIELDANLNEISSSSHQVTDHPVEDGSNISDHIIKDPEELQIDGLITNTPSSLVDALSASSTRAEDAYDELKTLQENQEPVSVFTSKREYENMVITRLARTRNSGVGEAVQFSISLREIKTVQSEVAEVPVRTDNTGKAKRNLGPKPVKDATDAQSTTALNKIADGISAGLKGAFSG